MKYRDIYALFIIHSGDKAPTNHNLVFFLYILLKYRLGAFIDITIPLLPKSEISSYESFSVDVQLGLFLTWLEIPEAGFLVTRLNCPCSEPLFIVTIFNYHLSLTKFRRNTCVNIAGGVLWKKIEKLLSKPRH